MKTFKNRILQKNNEINKLINSHNSFLLFGYNQIALFFLKISIAEKCIVDDLIKKKLEKQDKKTSFVKIDEIEPNSYIINCITGIKTYLVNDMLRNLGHVVFSWIEFKNAVQIYNFDYWYLVSFNEFFFKNNIKFTKVFSLLSDFQSKKEFIKILSYKVTGNEKSLKFSNENLHNQYFPNFININKKTQMLDVGAFDGDTIDKFFLKNKEYKNITAFEPDKKNFKKLQKKHINNKKITLLSIALGSSSKLVNFSSSKDSSRVDKYGKDQIIVKTLDSLCLKPNFIKVDIEGGERDFLIGAKKTISKQKPQLAICVYHKPEDFFNLVELVLNMNKKYKVYFRHHSLGFTESVMYFI